MKILISGNPAVGLAQALSIELTEHELTFISRTSGLDLTKTENQLKFAEMSVDQDVVIINSALWKFNQTLLLEAVYKKLKLQGRQTLIICIGSTTDRVMKATDWLYNAEKKALRDYCNSLGMTGVWDKNPRVTLISFGTLSNVQAKHPDRKTIPIQGAASYVKWILEQPAEFHINEISIDPLQ
jgi:hypothetical protein